MASIVENINEGIVITSRDQSVIMMNVPAKMILRVSEEEVMRWKAVDLFKSNYNLLEAYYKVMNSMEIKQQVLNTDIVVGGEILYVNFTCVIINNDQEGTGDIMMIFQPIQK